MLPEHHTLTHRLPCVYMAKVVTSEIVALPQLPSYYRDDTLELVRSPHYNNTNGYDHHAW